LERGPRRMSVHVQSTAEGRQIALLGAELQGEDLLELVSELGHAGQALELRIYDADSLPPELVLAMCARLDRGLALKLWAYKPLLAQALIRLGLPVRVAALPPQAQVTPPCRALVLGGSAQSLDKMLAIVEALPRSELLVFVVQHVLEKQPSLLDRLLKARSDYTVLMPQHLCELRAGTLYVAPPAHHMKVAHGMVYLTRDAPVMHARPSLDVLFESLALEFGEGLLGILLCGYGSDGVQGCEAIRRAGGWVLVEEGEECAPARLLPDAARAAQSFDLVLPLPALQSLAAVAVAPTEAGAAVPDGHLLDLFLQALHAQSWQDYRGYQRDSLRRRIGSLMAQLGLRSFVAFQRALLADPALLQRFNAELPVGVSSFFRHPAQLRELRAQVLPFLQSFPVLKVWCAGCSSGEEAYSLAILLEEAGLAARSHIFATDFNPRQLEAARCGLYPASSWAQSARNYADSGGEQELARYLRPQGRLLQPAPQLQQHLLFFQHSLTDEGIFNEFQLIVCRNVLIYFKPELQRQVLQCFAQSLHSEGRLVLGPQDGMGLMAKELGFVPLEPGSHIFSRGTQP